MRRLLAAVLIVPTITMAQKSPSDAVLIHQVDSMAKKLVATKGTTPSVAISVVRGGKTIVASAWGKADLEQDINATALNVYEIGSNTKQFASSAIMQLVEQGKVKIEDPISVYLPNLPAVWQAVTVHQLLNHTSGIPAYTGLPGWNKRWAEEMSPDTMLAPAAKVPMDFAPGAKWKYDNGGYVLLGMIIEHVTGRSWDADLADRFFKPLGLNATYDCHAAPLIPHRARGYDFSRKDSVWVNPPFFSVSQAFSAGAICSTVGDMAKWNAALNNGKVVNAASYKLMTTPEGAAVANKYGFGLIVDTVGGHRLISHGGGITGFSSANAYLPDLQLSVTVLTNSGGGGGAGVMQRDILRAALGLPPAPPPAPRPINPARPPAQ
jgi:CubicO group peptidase (beta-lactamase class C family)